MKKIISYLSVLLVIVSCGTPRKTTTSTQNATYKRDANVMHPQFVLFHVSDSISELHFKISSKELLYMRPDGINFYTNVLISYRLLLSYDSKEVVDSSSVRLVDLNNENADKYLLGKIKIKTRSAHTYFLHVTVADLNRNSEVETIMAVEKDNDLNRQNFLVKFKSTDTPLFRNYVKAHEELTITYKAKLPVSLFVRYYKRDFPLAAPPFSITDPRPFQYKQDSAFTLQLSANGSVNFTAFKKGFYHFQIDTSRREGLTIFYFSDGFPEVKKADEMVSPLRFITSQQEYDELISSTNKKAAIEKFWLNCTGNQDRAKDVIRKYYNRVQDANQYFTSYLEGWKSDRGMVYLIYGSPNVINKSSNSETWIYGEENNINSLSYTFSKVNNPFTNNDFTLERSVVYKQTWYTAVDIWRQGRTYLQD
jgi:GWxTD domain-containing protein